MELAAKGSVEQARHLPLEREALLVRSVGTMGLDQAALSRIAAQMRVLSGHYDQAARAAASL